MTIERGQVYVDELYANVVYDVGDRIVYTGVYKHGEYKYNTIHAKNGFCVGALSGRLGFNYAIENNKLKMIEVQNDYSQK